MPERVNTAALGDPRAELGGGVDRLDGGDVQGPLAAPGWEEPPAVGPVRPQIGPQLLQQSG